jgi:glutamate-ammonia-ligase adenylyltransferase
MNSSATPILAELFRAAPAPYDAARADFSMAELEARARSAGMDRLSALLAAPRVRALLLGVFGSSPFLTRLCLRDPQTLLRCLLASPDRYIECVLPPEQAAAFAAVSASDAMRVLRQAKQRLALFAALADVGEVWSVPETTAALSRGASELLQYATRVLLSRAAVRGQFRPQDPCAPERGSGYVVLGMGKLGAGELNYSSDVDLIIFYDPLRAPLAEGVEPGAFFVRLTRDLARFMQEHTGDGYVFRIDLRLRPDPGSTQAALSVAAAYQYYESFGQTWERAAYIKARPAAGDIECGETFLEGMEHYVWRKHLDFAAIADIHAMKRQIHAFKGHASIALAGHNLKLGRGGIREIEFFVQTQQLIAGGRQPGLRVRQTLAALDELAGRNWISQAAAQELAEVYCFLRRVEHRLQMIDDQQTHSLPNTPEGLERVALFSGFPDAASFSRALTARLERVQNHYAALFENVPELTSPAVRGNLVFSGDEDDPDTVETLASMGFANPGAVIATVRSWRYGRYPSMRSAAARELLTECTPALLEALGETIDPGLALASFDKFISELPAGAQLFALLRNAPALLRLVADIMGSAPRLASILSRRRKLLDAVLDPGFMGALPSDRSLETIIRTALSNTPNYEDYLNRARVVGQEQAFLIGVRVLSGAIPAFEAGPAYASLAGHLIEAITPRVDAELARQHGPMRGGQAAVIAMGKLGGREMAANSDLDLIIVYDYDASHPQSEGSRPLSGPQYYARFTQRLIAALSAPTPEGSLYEVDMRLRPSGSSGPVAASLASFIAYQQRDAWTWEHMALTRARVVAGSPALREAIEKTIAEVLARPRDPARIAADVRDMRVRIEREKDARGDVWNVKQARGGLIDLEFIAQYLQLVGASRAPEVLDQNTAAAFRKLAAAGLLSPAHADVLLRALTLYHNLSQVLRLCLEGPFVPAQAPDGLKALLAEAGGAPDFARLEAHLRETLAEAAGLFDALIPAPSGASAPTSTHSARRTN